MKRLLNEYREKQKNPSVRIGKLCRSIVGANEEKFREADCMCEH